MIGTIRKHSSWVWGVIIVVTIITFVFWGSQTGKQDGTGGSANLGTLYGKHITPDQYRAALAEVSLQYFFSYGSWPDQDSKRNGFDVEKQTYFRLVLIAKQQELGIHPDKQTVAKLADLRLRQLNRGGDAVPLTALETQVLKPRGLTTTDFVRYLEHDLAIQEVIAVAAAGSKMVTPEEIRELYTREHEEMSVQAVFFNGSNYLTSVSVAPDDFNRFYTNQMARYHLPERVQVDYVQFSASNYMADATALMAQMTNIDDKIEAYYEQYGTNFQKGLNSPAEAKAKIRQFMTEEQALLVARKKANDFATMLNDLQPAKPGNLAKLAAEKGLPLHTTAPFDRQQPPAGLPVGPTFNKVAFALNPDEPFNGPIVGEDTVYEIELKQRLPAENPPLADVHDQVMGDFKNVQAIQVARIAGTTFHTALTNSITPNNTFAAICAKTGKSVVTPAPFSLSTRELPEIEKYVTLNLFKQAVFSTLPGSVSVFVPTETGGFLVYVRSRLPVDQTRMQAELPAFAGQVKQGRVGEAFNMWLSREMSTALRDVPALRPQPEAATAEPTGEN